MSMLEFTLDAADVPLLARWTGMRTSRSFPLDLVWHDTPDAALAAAGRALVCTGPAWRLEPLRVRSAAEAPVPEIETRRPALLPALPDGLRPVARWSGRRQALLWTGDGERVALRLLNGVFQNGKPACRVTFDGDAPALPALAASLAGAIGLRPPGATLAAEALAHATGHPPEPRALGAPQVSDGLTVSDSLAVIVGHLTDVMLHWSERVPHAATPEPVHQMRVALRRLRSALTIYKRAAACAELASLTVPLKLCAARLGAARDWDVFLDGLGARLADAFPGDPRCAAMLRMARKRRVAAYADLRAFLSGPKQRMLAVALASTAALRPWDRAGQGAGQADTLAQDTAGFAAVVLGRRMKRVRQAGRGIETLPIPALHELRKDCKRLRYAAEFFGPLFPQKRTRRFIARLSDLQEELGLLNDGAAVAGLMAQLGRLERSYAAGLVEGFSAAHAGPARERIVGAWKRFRRAELFWPS